MTMKFTDLQCREVICLGTGQRLGFVADVVLEIPEGRVCALTVPCPGKMAGLLAPREEYIIPFGAIEKIGPDILLIQANPEQCRCPRVRPGGSWGKK